MAAVDLDRLAILAHNLDTLASWTA